MPQERDLDQLAINTICTLAIDAIQKANSGHLGTPMDATPTVYTLWQRILRYDPEYPDWFNRDRFVLSSGVVLGMRTFGMSAPMKIVAEHFGFTPEHVVAAAKETLARSHQR
jgi:transketolase